jgi:LPPG:FO 2-phospho-L-lactate transferase
MSAPSRITVLGGGIGAARFLKGLRLIPNLEISVIVNSGDDIWMHGLRICPDLDSVIYNLAGASDLVRGWGRGDETWTIQEELANYHGERPWFNLGDKDFATHIYRTELLSQGVKLNEIVAAQCARWGIAQKILPSTNEYVETQVHLAQVHDGKTALHFQEWWVRHRAALPAVGFELTGKDIAKPAPGVLEAIHGADVILFAPSNPIVSTGTILQVAGIREALVESSAPIVGVSPIIGGNPVLGMADKCLTALKLETSATSVATLYGSRSHGGLLNGWLIADSDSQQVEGIEKLGMACQAIPLLMSDDLATQTMAEAAIELAQSVSN